MGIADSGFHRLIIIICSCALVVLSLIFSASESAFLSINKLRVRFLRIKKDDKRAIRCGKLLEHKEKLLHTLLIGNNIVNILLTALLTSLALDVFGSAGVGLATIAATIVLLLFGEIGPKTIAAHYPEPTAFLFSRFISIMVVLFTPLTALAALASRAFSKNKNQEKKVSFTEEDIKTFIEIGAEEGVLETREKTMMHRVLTFTDLAARDIMESRTTIVAVPINASYRDVLELSERSRLSRFPVCGKDIDDIVGVLYVKDMLLYKTSPAEFSVTTVMRNPLFIPGTKKMSTVQQVLRENRQRLAIIVDEYSGTAGILSIEDIAEEIFGKISDEYSLPQKQSIVKIHEGEYLCDASIKLSFAAEKTGIALESKYYETLAGFMLEKLDSIPCLGDSVSLHNAVLTVSDVTEKKIIKVHIKKLDGQQ
jgi:CBS domain containing-hemolysin-like protein